MEAIEIFGYIGALFIGVSLGLIGGGGSILTVPILVYALALNPITATAYSLFVVGTTSLVGSIKNLSKGMVDLRTTFVFALPALIQTFLTRKYIIHAIPETLFITGGFVMTKELAIMLFFAFIMLLASFSMIKVKKELCDAQPEPDKETNYPFLIIQGVVVGTITGLLGAGGGFLIIPALVLLARLPMKKAVATSLLIIAINSLIGFLGDVSNLDIDWSFLFLFTLIPVLGIFIGIWLNRFVNGQKLQKAFGWFVLLMGIYIIYKELSS
ncbi:MAG: permease [Cytophagaceae bacterium]|nr:permease [Cytophagaceae bacterium]|tara:strand:- start:574 stop:1380 length:807 start_codon:yes stop_codon:yes gene_type:complete